MNKYYLAVETSHNNYFPIHLTDLKIFPKSPFKLEEIDSLTLKFTKQEIMNAIMEANLLDITDNMPLVIVYYEKNKARIIPALTKDLNFNMWQNIKTNYQDKNYRNLIINFLTNKIDDITLNALKNSTTIEEFLTYINSLTYIIERKLFFYLYEK